MFFKNSTKSNILQKTIFNLDYFFIKYSNIKILQKAMFFKNSTKINILQKAIFYKKQYAPLLGEIPII